MDIVTRLKMFLDQTGISNSQFADTCEIPRPTLSQLLNGRNKKVSDEVIGKIHRAYPTLNVMWLMFGDGEMLTMPKTASSPMALPATTWVSSVLSRLTTMSRWLTTRQPSRRSASPAPRQ